jgi:hypothetical protein
MLGMGSARRPIRRSTLAFLAVVATSLLSGPAAAHAGVVDLAISQSASANVVKQGETVTIAVKVDNVGSEGTPSGVGVGLVGLGGGDRITDNPYLSSSTTQGTCADETVGQDPVLFCRLGPVATGASVRITAVVRMNETMNHAASLDEENGNETYADYNLLNNSSFMKVSASSPPVVTGSKKIQLPGLPDGCVEGDFPLTVVVAAPGVKKVVASLFLGFGKGGVGGGDWQRVARGPRLRATVPASRISEPGPTIGRTYKLKVKARLKGGTRLKRTVEFQLC